MAATAATKRKREKPTKDKIKEISYIKRLIKQFRASYEMRGNSFDSFAYTCACAYN